MTKQELKDLMGRHYPEHPEYENTLLIRVKFFPNCLDVYSDHLSNIYTRANEWFLLEQLMPETANDSPAGVKPIRKIESFIEHYLIFNSSGTVLFGSKNINWESIRPLLQLRLNKPLYRVQVKRRRWMPMLTISIRTKVEQP